MYMYMFTYTSIYFTLLLYSPTFWNIFFRHNLKSIYKQKYSNQYVSKLTHIHIYVYIQILHKIYVDTYCFTFFSLPTFWKTSSCELFISIIPLKWKLCFNFELFTKSNFKFSGRLNFKDWEDSSLGLFSLSLSILKKPEKRRMKKRNKEQ